MSCHTVEQRLERWLLMTRDRANSSELFLTHEVLAMMVYERTFGDCEDGLEARASIGRTAAHWRKH